MLKRRALMAWEKYQMNLLQHNFTSILCDETTSNDAGQQGKNTPGNFLSPGVYAVIFILQAYPIFR